MLIIPTLTGRALVRKTVRWEPAQRERERERQRERDDTYGIHRTEGTTMASIGSWAWRGEWKSSSVHTH
jgi:hypothetical protein